MGIFLALPWYATKQTRRMQQDAGGGGKEVESQRLCQSGNMREGGRQTDIAWKRQEEERQEKQER